MEVQASISISQGWCHRHILFVLNDTLLKSCLAFCGALGESLSHVLLCKPNFSENLHNIFIQSNPFLVGLSIWNKICLYQVWQAMELTLVISCLAFYDSMEESLLHVFSTSLTTNEADNLCDSSIFLWGVSLFTLGTFVTIHEWIIM